MAKARALIAAASFDSATLKMIGQAFDHAWASVAQSYTSPLAIEAARLKLANIVLSLAADGVRDPAHLSDRACGFLLSATRISSCLSASPKLHDSAATDAEALHRRYCAGTGKITGRSRKKVRDRCPTQCTKQTTGEHSHRARQLPPRK